MKCKEKIGRNTKNKEQHSEDKYTAHNKTSREETRITNKTKQEPSSTLQYNGNQETWKQYANKQLSH